MAGQILASGSTLAISDASTTVNANANQILTMTGTPTGGTTVLTYGGGLGALSSTNPLVSGTVPFSATAAQVATVLTALANIGNNAAGQPNIVAGVTGGTGPWPGTPIGVTFQNDLGNQPVPLIGSPASGAAGNNLTGGATPQVNVTLGTAGVKAGGVYAAISRLSTIAFPNTKADIKEVTNFDSTGVTKEYIQGYIAPGDVAIDGQWIGDATQDWKVGVIAKFFGHQVWLFRTNVPSKLPGAGVFTPGAAIYYQGFFTDGSLQAAKHDDVVMVRGAVQISGLPIYGVPVQ